MEALSGGLGWGQVGKELTLLGGPVDPLSLLFFLFSFKTALVSFLYSPNTLWLESRLPAKDFKVPLQSVIL